MSVIEVQDMSWVRGDKQILKHINWQVGAGEHWTIIGLNGSGKTSLLKMVTGYEWPTRGKIRVLGNTYGECEIQQVRKSIGWVSSALRDEIYPSDRAIDVVISGKFASIGIWQAIDKSDRERALQLLTRLGCSRLATAHYGTLSQGEKQKVLLARALMAEPKLLILDEPCFGLDIRAREQLLSEISKMGSAADTPAILYVTHHIEEILPIFTHVLLLREGEVVAAGLKRDVLTSDNLQRAFGLPVTVEWAEERPWIKIGKNRAW
ncbi:ABC transporter ATP-binding protein [Effusibacillus pohliae]|uniref:ABC transporter ATP-binding protein n=1 Tax=Effusibacillus pohliae TaxID=232270 RepID=UPI0003661C02|nr:ABC transporter ATP-binding protein [Effusibacillus pohliae]